MSIGIILLIIVVVISVYVVMTYNKLIAEI
ncbi:LemA family protein, partial [Francisella tularensis subsp. holarctica]|nr:LemA family protein [Francisella tularensis subsp. holarctica]